MKKVIWSSTLIYSVLLIVAGCSGPDTEKKTDQPDGQMKMAAAPTPGSCLQATEVHRISYNVMKMLANDFINCDCQPNLDDLYFGSFIDSASIADQISGASIEGVYLHLCLSDENEFYVALSGSTGIADSVLTNDSVYPIGQGTFIFKSNTFDNFINTETFELPGTKSLTGQQITEDRKRFASNLTCDLDSSGTQDSLATVPYGFVNIGEFQELLDQSSAPFIAFLLGYDPTMYPSVMRVMMVSTEDADAAHIKLVKMNPTAPSQYALFLDRQRP